MPAITPGSKVLVTGASGYVAVHCIAALLDEGFQVLGTVRSADKGDYLIKKFEGKPFDYIIVRDIRDPGVFADAVKGIEGILHTASPFYMGPKGGDPNDLIEPAVKGTLGVLEAAKNSETVKRIVVTSSVAAIFNPRPAPYTFTEKDWNTISESEIKAKGKDAAAGNKYQASKTLAERAAWDFVKEQKPQWDLTVINPPWVFGPILQDLESAEKLNTSVAAYWDVASGNVPNEGLPAQGGGWVDARDVAAAHVKSLTTPEAGGQRFIVCNGSWSKQDFAELTVKTDPSLKERIATGNPGAAAEANSPANALIFSGAHAQKVLGIQYHTLEESVRDMYTSIKERGFEAVPRKSKLSKL